jgi:phosphatidylserine synthase
MQALIPFAIVLAPSHFTAAALFAVFTSIVFAITQRSGVREQVRYGFYCFALFIGGVFAAGWLMLLLRR